MQGTSDLNADFRVKESPDGALYLESVTCPTACVGIQSEGQLKTGLSVFLMVRTCSNYHHLYCAAIAVTSLVPFTVIPNNL